MRSKQDFQQLVQDLFTPILPYLESQGSHPDFHEGGAIFDMSASGLEGVARPLWGIIPLVKGGGEFKHWHLYHDIITQGTDPESERYWGAAAGINQRSVEMAAFGLLLAVLPEHGWDPLPEVVQDNFAAWLANIQNCPMPQNNWLFFTILVQAGLRKVGRSDLVDIDVEADYLNKLKSFYLGDGWYGDGEVANIDHYGGFAIHFYSIIYATLFDNPDRELSQLFLDRAEAYCEPFSYWFAESGECLAQGRSLTYRFATAGFWGAVASLDLASMKPGAIKGMWARQIRQWKDKPIFTQEGLLSRGYDYPNLKVCEGYNSPTSPYWAFKAFYPLMLEDNHPFWQSEEQEQILDKNVYPMPAARSIVQRINGHSIVHFAGPIEPQFELDKYNKFAYSTCFGADIGALQYSNMLSFGDNILAFSFDQGANWQTRLSNSRVEVDHNDLVIEWTSGSVDVTTLIQVLENGESIRTHEFEIHSAAWIVETGFAVSNWYQERQTLQQASGISATVELLGTTGSSLIMSQDQHNKDSKQCCRIHSNLVSPRTHVPYLLTKLEPGKHKISSKFIVSPNNN
ncbi:DUF2264 domain-containing protein [Photobacterium sp. ZSDE20]|uniref:DUF2264 domain-containing protein n=2 Tax=Photobacterium pectinilyticum TaxID=2906793 RepID=A0ABT1MVE6_9GAMM|nr:DUF2264 domain-containing protein [Photobacterium sp. ZSDE20]